MSGIHPSPSPQEVPRTGSQAGHSSGVVQEQIQQYHSSETSTGHHAVLDARGDRSLVHTIVQGTRTSSVSTVTPAMTSMTGTVLTGSDRYCGSPGKSVETLHRSPGTRSVSMTGTDVPVTTGHGGVVLTDHRPNNNLDRSCDHRSRVKTVPTVPSVTTGLDHPTTGHHRSNSKLVRSSDHRAPGISFSNVHAPVMTGQIHDSRMHGAPTKDITGHSNLTSVHQDSDPLSDPSLNHGAPTFTGHPQVVATNSRQHRSSQDRAPSTTHNFPTLSDQGRPQVLGHPPGLYDQPRHPSYWANPSWAGQHPLVGSHMPSDMGIHPMMQPYHPNFQGNFHFPSGVMHPQFTPYSYGLSGERQSGRRQTSSSASATRPRPRSRSRTPSPSLERASRSPLRNRDCSPISSSDSSPERQERPERPLSVDAPRDDPLLQEEDSRSRDQRTDSSFRQESTSREETSSLKEDPLPPSFSLSSAFKVVYDTLPEDLCPPLPPVAEPSFVSTGEEALWRELPAKPAAKADILSIPVSKTLKRCLTELEEANKASFDRSWSVPAKTLKNFMPTGVYRPPRKDIHLSLDLESPSPLDPECTRARINKPPPSSSCPLPISTLERWEAREKQSLGIASQLDMLCATLAKLSSQEELDLDAFRQVLMAASKSTAYLSALTASNTAELIRARRSFVLDSSSKFLLESSKKRLLTAPLDSPFLFGGIVQEVLSLDKEDQLHASIARRPPPPQKPAQQVKGQAQKRKLSSAPPAPQKKQKFSAQGSKGKSNPPLRQTSTFHPPQRKVTGTNVTVSSAPFTGPRGNKQNP